MSISPFWSHLTYNNSKILLEPLGKINESFWGIVGKKRTFFLYLTKSKSYLLDDCTFQYVLSYVCLCITIKGGFSMRDLKTYLSVAPVLSTLWFGSLAGLLIEINRFFPDALTFPFFSF
jgi:photosystem I subunit 9